MVRIAIIFFWFVCVAWPGTATAVSWPDAMGRSVEVPEAPQRIVSLVPSVTEILFALGLEDRVAGVTSFCTYPEQALDKPQVGGYANPSLEAVILQQPDLVFISADSASPALLSRMERLGLSVYVVYPRGIEETIEMIRAVGQVTGAALGGDRLAQQLTDSVARVRAAVAGRQRPRVLFCIMVRPLTVAGPETLVGDLIEAAGGENVVPTGPSRYPTWGAEALLLADPDLIVVSPHPGTPNPTDLFSPWPELTAVKENRIVSVTPDWVHRPGPRLSFGLVALAEAMHGIDLSAETLPE
ncbi:MAG: cobalamin-binding protein [Desulfuromonadales bacterium]|nr:cobalamin-binding protein [Desulfuromonadales bacterium]